MQVQAHVDPRINLSTSVVEHMAIVGQNSRKYIQAFPAVVQSGSLSTSISLPHNCITSRTVYIQNTFQFTFNGTNSAGGATSLILPGDGYNALRFLPFQQCVNSTQINFGGLAFQTQSNEEVDFLCRTIPEEQKATWMSGGLSCQDTTQNYGDAASMGPEINPLGQIGSHADFNARGGHAYQIVSNTSTRTVVNVTWWEPIVCPPFLANPIAEVSRKGFANVDQIQFQFILTGDYTRAWSHDNTQPNVTLNAQSNANPGIVAVMTAIPQLIFTITEPNPLAGPIPRSVLYETWRNQPQVSATQTLTSLATNATLGVQTANTVQMTIPTFTLSAFPEYLIIYFRPTPSYRNYATSDTYAQITNIQIDVGARANILNEYTVHDLYQMTKANGLSVSFSQWQRALGSLLIISAKDIGLSLGNAPGVQAPTQISVRCQVTNITGVLGNSYQGSAYTGQLYLWACFSSKLAVHDGKWNEETSYLTAASVKQAVGGAVGGGGVDCGGGFLDDLRGTLGTIYGAVRRPFHQQLNRMGPWGQVASSGIRALGGGTKRRLMMDDDDAMGGGGGEFYAER